MSPECSYIHGFYIVKTKGLNIDERNVGKVAIALVAILEIGEMQDPSPPKVRVIFHDYR